MKTVKGLALSYIEINYEPKITKAMLVVLTYKKISR